MANPAANSPNPAAVPGNAAAAPQGGNTAQYEDAIQTLKIMFEDLDVSVIEAILEQNQGHMENTVEEILTLQSQPSPNARAPAANPMLVQAVGPIPRVSENVNLLERVPVDFLRPPSYYNKTRTDQISQDAAMAAMLQNEFNQIRFAGGYQQGVPLEYNGRQNRVVPAPIAAGQNQGPNRDPNRAVSPTFGEKMSNMSSKAKEKLAALGDRLNRRRYQARGERLPDSDIDVVEDHGVWPAAGSKDEDDGGFANLEDDSKSSPLITNRPESEYEIAPDKSPYTKGKNAQSAKYEPLEEL